MITVLLPPGRLLIEKTVNVLSGVYVKGDGADRTLIKCKVGEGKHCFELKPNKAQSIGIVKLQKPILKGNDSVSLNSISVVDLNLNPLKSYLAAVVKYNDDSLITSSWAKGSVKEHFWLQLPKKLGSDYKFPSSVSNSTGQTSQFEFAGLGNYSSDNRFSGIRYYKKSFLLDYDTALDHSAVEVYESIKYAGILCLGIERLDTTTTQTSNIKLTNAAHCIIKAVESKGCNFAHIELNNSFLNIIKRCHIYDGNGYGGDGKAYGVLLQEGSSSNTVLDNVLHHLRHSILLQSGANNNIIIANYSFDPYWEETSLPANSAGDLVLHGNYPFGNIFEFNVAQQIVIDDSYGKNGSFNIFHRNWLQGYGIAMSAPNGSDSQVFTGNEITNSGFQKGLYYLQDKGHFEYGNQVKGSLQPNNSQKELTKSITGLNYFGFYDRRTRRSEPPAIIDYRNVPFGEPFNQSNKSNDARTRDTATPPCYNYATDNNEWDGVQTVVSRTNNFIYPNPSNGKINISEIGELSIYDLNGRLVHKQIITNPSEIEITGLKGLFIAKLKTETQVFSQKILFD